jgi:hypothetical protein
MTENDFKTDIDLLEPIDLSAGDAASPASAEQPDGVASTPKQTEPPDGHGSSPEPAEPPDGVASSPEPTVPPVPPPSKRRRLLLALGALAVGCATAVGAWFYARPTPLTSPAAELAPPVDQATDSENGPGPSSAARSSVSFEGPNGWTARLRDVDELRRLLESKRHEISKIKQGYQYGIFELEDETRRLLKQARIDSLVLARKNSDIDLLLKNIQRRQIYSETLERTMQWLDAASEELLYMKRRASVDALVATFAEGIDLRRHLNELDLALQKFQPTPSRLLFDPRSIATPSVEATARRLIEQAKLMPVSSSDDRNQEIVAEVCSGNVMRAGELSKLSLKGARCLAESTAKQLFLNRLTELSPLAAQKLAEWPGEWLCLNGLSKLDADVAARLFAWQGPWISLNGLRDLSVEAGKQVAGWNGRQLELMGLHKPFGMEYLVQWEAAGGRLFVPEALRRTIDPAARNASGNSDS